MTFEARFQGDTTFDITIAVTNLGVGDNNAGVRGGVTAGGRREKHSEEVGDRWSQQPGRLQIGKTVVSGTVERVHLVHDAPKYGADLLFVRTAPSWRPGSGRTSFGREQRRFYEFSLPMPLAHVEGRLRLGNRWFPVRGTGMIDHSRTNIFPHEQATRWWRFRSQEPDRVVQLTQFLTTREYGAQRVGWLVVIEQGRLLFDSLDYDFRVSELRPDPEYPSYGIAWRYEFAQADRMRGVVRAERQISRGDYLASMGALKRMIVRQFARPVGVELRGPYEVTLTLPEGPHRLTGQGFLGQTFIK